MSRVGAYFTVVVIFGGFYVLQLFTSVMIITLSHCTHELEEQEEEAREREAMGLPPMPSAFAPEDDKVGEFVNWVGRGVTRCVNHAKTVMGDRVEQGKDGVRVRRSVLPASLLSEARRLQRFVEHNWFQRVILFIICLNTVTMAADHHGATAEFVGIVYWFEFSFTIIFIAEFGVKHVAYGPVWYWTNPWNVVDGVIVISGILELSMGDGAEGVSMLRMLRVMRIFAGLKALRRYRAFRQVFAAILNGSVRIASFCLVFFLFIIVFAILGMQLFGGVGELDDLRLHFDTFGNAILTLFVICTGENTFNVAWDLMRASGTDWAVVYIMLWSLVSTSLLALVLGVLIEAAASSFEMSDEAEDGAAGDEGQDGDGSADGASPGGKTVSPGGSLSDDIRANILSKEQGMNAMSMFKSKAGAALVDQAGLIKNEEEEEGGRRNPFARLEQKVNRADDLAAKEEAEEAELQKIQHHCKVEVTAIRIWLLQNNLGGEDGATSGARVAKPLTVKGVMASVRGFGSSVASLRKGLNIPTFDKSSNSPTDKKSAGPSLRTTMLVKNLAKGWRNNSPAAILKRLEPQFSTEEMEAARNRLVTMAPGKHMKHEKPIKFSIGNTTSKVFTVEDMLKKKRDERDAELAAEAEAAKEHPAVRADRLMRERAAEVGIDPDQDAVRLYSLHLNDRGWFQALVLVLITISSVLLAPQCSADWPPPGSAMEKSMEAVDIFFTAAFAVEMSIKLVAFTVYSGPRAYLKDSWNCLDGFIVLMSVLTYALSNFGGGVGGVLKAFRVLRVLRPLRMIKNIPSLKLVIDATLVSMPSIMTVCALGVIIMVIVGVLGMNLFKGQFWFCSLEEPSGTKAGCEAAGGEWQNPPFNFDNIGHAAVAVFIISTGDNWQDIMWAGTDINGVNKQPMAKNAPANAFYFVFVIVIAFFFWANLFVSALVDNFSQVASELKGSGEGSEGYNYSESQRKWLQALNIGLEKAKEEWRDVPADKLDMLRRFCLKIRKWKHWDAFVMSFIGLNAVQLCLMRHGAPPEEEEIMDIFSIIFSTLYVLETAINITAMEWAVYWDSNWHRLDFVITILGVMELASDLTGGTGGFVTVFRTARFFRLFKVLKTSRGLRSLVNTFLSALPAVINIMMLMALLMHIYACLGCTMYGSIAGPYHGIGLTPYMNFTDWASAMSLLFVVLSGNWADAFQDVYWSCATKDADPVTGAYGADGCPYRWSAIFYFFSFVVFGICLLCNLFVAILLERFDYASTMEGVYDDQNPFDMMRRLTIIRRFAYKIRNRLRLVGAVRNVELFNKDNGGPHEELDVQNINSRIKSFSKSFNAGGQEDDEHDGAGQSPVVFSSGGVSVDDEGKRKIRAALIARMRERGVTGDAAALAEEALDVMEEHLSPASAGAGARAARSAPSAAADGKRSIRGAGGGGSPGGGGGVSGGRSKLEGVMAAAAAAEDEEEVDEEQDEERRRTLSAQRRGGESRERASAARGTPQHASAKPPPAPATIRTSTRNAASNIDAVVKTPSDAMRRRGDDDDADDDDDDDFFDAKQPPEKGRGPSAAPGPRLNGSGRGGDGGSENGHWHAATTPYSNASSSRRWAEMNSGPSAVERSGKSAGRWGQAVEAAKQEEASAASPGVISGIGNMVGTLGSMVWGVTKQLSQRGSLAEEEGGGGGGDVVAPSPAPGGAAGNDGDSQASSRGRLNKLADDNRRSVKNVGRLLSQRKADNWRADPGGGGGGGGGGGEEDGPSPPRAANLQKDRGGYGGTGIMLERFMAEPDNGDADFRGGERDANGTGGGGMMNGGGGDGGRAAWRRSAKAVKAATRIAMMSKGGRYAVSGNETAPPTEAPSRWMGNPDQNLEDIDELHNVGPSANGGARGGGGGGGGGGMRRDQARVRKDMVDPYSTPAQEYPESEYNPTHESGIHERL
jgi:hypothetical protein